MIQERIETGMVDLGEDETARRETCTAFADPEFSRLEGFATPAEAMEVWHKLHPNHPVQQCWAIAPKTRKMRTWP